MSSEPKNNEEYIDMIRKQQRELEREHVPSHRELYKEYGSEKDVHLNKFFYFFGVMVVIVISYFAITYVTNSRADPNSHL